MTDEELNQLKADLVQAVEFTKSACLKAEKGDYHKEENGLVTFYRANGHAFMIMPAEDFEDIKKWHKDNA